MANCNLLTLQTLALRAQAEMGAQPAASQGAE